MKPHRSRFIRPGRYLTVTGHHVAGTPDRIGPAPKALALLKARVERFKAEEKAAKKAKQDAEREAARAAKAAGQAERTGHHGGSKQTSNSPFWRSIKDAALANLDAWVPLLFPEASYQPGTGAYRIKSSQLGRKLQEDLAIHPDGITDWGTRETLTAIDLVMWRNGGTDKDAAFWLCDRLGRSPDTFGWNKNLDSNLRPYTHPPGVGAAQGRAKGTSADEARETLRRHLEMIMRTTLDWHERWKGTDPRIAATHRTARSGSRPASASRGIRRMIARFIRRAKLRGLPHRVLYLVGTHRLADEAKQRLPEGVTSAIWQGRAAEKLGTDGEPMCLNPAAVEAAIKIGGEVEKTACRKAKRGADHDLLPVLRALSLSGAEDAGRTGRRGVRSPRFLLKVPTAIGEFGLIVVDEAFWQDALFGTAPKSRLVISSMADELIEAPVRRAGERRKQDSDRPGRGVPDPRRHRDRAASQ